MRIRKSVARLRNSAYSMPTDLSPKLLPPPVDPASCSTPLGSNEVDNFSSSPVTSKELCEHNRNPWDLVYDLPLFEPQVVNDLLDSYYVDLKYKTSWLFSPSMPIMLVKKTKDEMVATRRDKVKQQELRKTVVKKDKMPKKDGKKKMGNMEGEATKKANVMNKKGDEGAPWSCTPLAPKQEEEKTELPKDAYPLSLSKVKVGDGSNYGFASHDGVPSVQHNDGVVGIDEGRKDDEHNQGSSSHNKINMKRNENPCKRRRKPVKARSIKSLLEQNHLQEK